jgi:hypothetical protein
MRNSTVTFHLELSAALGLSQTLSFRDAQLEAAYNDAFKRFSHEIKDSQKRKQLMWLLSFSQNVTYETPMPHLLRVTECWKAGITAECLYDRYRGFGETPYILCLGVEEKSSHFDPWAYARERAKAKHHVIVWT